MTATLTQRKILGRGVALVALACLLVLMISPFIIIAINAFKEAGDYAARGPLSLPAKWTLDGVSRFWARVKFTNKLWNSLVISGVVAVLAVALSLLNSFALGRNNFV